MERIHVGSSRSCLNGDPAHLLAFYHARVPPASSLPRGSRERHGASVDRRPGGPHPRRLARRMCRDYVRGDAEPDVRDFDVHNSSRFAYPHQPIPKQPPGELP
eukprot:4161994-Pyramimonas_sp.AAC.1